LLWSWHLYVPNLREKTTPRGVTNLDVSLHRRACPRENNPSRVDKSGCFPTQRAVIVLLYFCQSFIGYVPCGGKLGCSAGNNRVVSRQRKCLPMFYRLSPLWGKLGCSAGNNRVVWRGTIGLFGGEQ
jgi:hypothetical protein